MADPVRHQAGDPVLSVRDLVVEIETPRGTVRPVDGVSFDVLPGEVLAVVGESGSGKSVTVLAVMGLLPPNARIVSGEVLLHGEDLRRATRARLRALRGAELAMVFQDPMTALNPVHRVGKQIGEMVRLHAKGLSRKQVEARVVELLERVHVPDARHRARNYPHQFSGGMRQRAVIAMAMAHDPGLLIADEPTTALDVTIQAQVMSVLREVREEVGSSLVLITHDLGLVAQTADRIVVMYSGRVAETGTADEVFHAPQHPYTVELLRSLLHADSTSEKAYALPGLPPNIAARPSGCAFRTRCQLGGDRERCAQVVPLPLVRGDGRVSACHYPDEVPEFAAAGSAEKRSA
jgi:oligopeptide/dipeptide ABC transporter ATP-binding protein